MIGGIGASATPSVQSLVTMVTSDADLGQVLAALTIVEGTVLAIRNPVLFGIYNATLGGPWDGAVWWCSAVSRTFIFLSSVISYRSLDGC